MAQMMTIDSKETLPYYTTIYQVDDGTIFYSHKAQSKIFKCLLYAILEGKTVDATLPPGNFSTVVAFGNAVYFETAGKIYKALVCGGKIDVSFERDVLEGVRIDSLGLCSMSYGEDCKYVHKMCDEFGQDGVLVATVPYPILQSIIHRGKIYNIRRYETKYAKLTATAENVVVVELPLEGPLLRAYAREDSPFLYITNRYNLHVFNVETMETLPVLQFEWSISHLTVVGVVNGVITATAFKEGSTHKITAQLPEGYYGNATREATASPVKEEKKKDTLDMRIEELASQHDIQFVNYDQRISANEKYLDEQIQKLQTEFPAAEKRRIECEQEMSAAMNQLIDQNMELTQQIEDLKKKSKEDELSTMQSRAKTCEINSEILNKHRELETLNWELSSELTRTEDHNDELEAANAQLTKEKEALIKKNEKMENEKSAIIAEIEAEIAKIEEKNRANREHKELQRIMEMIQKQNEKLSKALSETAETSSGEEYEMIDNE